MKDIQDDTKKWEDNPCLWIRINIIKMSIIPKVIHKFNAILIKISGVFFLKTGINYPKIYMEIQNIPNNKSNFEKGKKKKKKKSWRYHAF